MKKGLMALLAMGFISTSLMAEDTTISQIWIKADTTVLYLANGKACGIGVNNNMTADYTQQFLATALTAKAAGSTVSVNIDGSNCKNIFLK